MNIRVETLTTYEIACFRYELPLSASTCVTLSNSSSLASLACILVKELTEVNERLKLLARASPRPYFPCFFHTLSLSTTTCGEITLRPSVSSSRPADDRSLRCMKQSYFKVVIVFTKLIENRWRKTLRTELMQRNFDIGRKHQTHACR